MTRIVAGLFDNRGDAERTIEHLIQEFGVDPNAVEVHGAGRQVGRRSLADLSLPREDESAYREGVRRGGIVVAARVEEAVADRAMDVFEEYGAADLDAREADWRGAGWTAAPGQGGYTGHDEDIGFATYGEDAVVGHVPRHHHDNSPAGALGRMEMATTRRAAGSRARVRSYELATAPAALGGGAQAGPAAPRGGGAAMAGRRDAVSDPVLAALQDLLREQRATNELLRRVVERLPREPR
jgi:hypothetical protein